MSTGDGSGPATTPEPGGTVHGHVSDVSGGQVAVGGRVFQIDAAQGSYVVINAESEVEIVRRPTPVLRPPPAIPGFVARGEELRRVRAALDSGLSVEVHGHGGIGKTALLRAASNYPLAGSTPDGVVAFPARLGAADTLSYVFDTCYVGTRRVVPRREELTSALADLRLLVVVDDTSLGLDDIEALREALPSSLLLLAGLEQRVFDPGVVGIALGGLTADEGVDLIQAAVGRDLTQRERDVGARVSEVLHGVPLELVRFASLVRADEGDLVSVARGFGVDAQPEELLVAVRRSVSVEEEAVLAALTAFDAPVGAGPVAAFARNTDAGALLRQLCERGLVQGDDLQGWRVRDHTPVPPEDRRQAAAVLTAWVRSRAVPEEVAGEIPAIARALDQARQDNRWVDAMALAAAAEGPLALAGRWSAWRDTLQAGRSAAQSAGDEASGRFFDHELAVMDDAMAGVMAVTEPTASTPTETPPAPPPPERTSAEPTSTGHAGGGLDDAVPIRWGRVIAAAATMLVIIGLGAAAALRFASAREGTQVEPTTVTSPSATDATTAPPPTNGGTTSLPPNLQVFTLGAEAPFHLVVDRKKEFTVRVSNSVLKTREVGASKGGELTIRLNGDEAELVDGPPWCTLTSGSLRCTLGELPRKATVDVRVMLRGRAEGSVVLESFVQDTGSGGEDRELRTFTVSQGTCTVPNVVGMDEERAGAALEAAGLKSEVVTGPPGEASGLVIKQSPDSEEELACGGTVTLEVSGSN